MSRANATASDWLSISWCSMRRFRLRRATLSITTLICFRGCRSVAIIVISFGSKFVGAGQSICVFGDGSISAPCGSERDQFWGVVGYWVGVLSHRVQAVHRGDSAAGTLVRHLAGRCTRRILPSPRVLDRILSIIERFFAGAWCTQFDDVVHSGLFHSSSSMSGISASAALSRSRAPRSFPTRSRAASS